jgi:hypothetical protein
VVVIKMQIGQPFNPFRLFTGIFIPEGLVRAKCISPGAKLTYGRLARYAGQKGQCYAAVESRKLSRLTEMLSARRPVGVE